MARMNDTKKTTFQKDTKLTKNHEGSTVHNLNSLEAIFSRVLGSFFGESTAYEKRTPEDEFLKLAKTITDVSIEDIEYVLKIALIAREYNMIQYPLSVLTACFNDERFKGENFLDMSGKNKLQYYSNKIIRRGRDITDVLSTQINVYGFEKTPIGKHASLNHTRFKRDMPLPIQLRKALKYKLESFDEYQLSKALGDGREVSMADCIKLLHPNESKARVRKGFYKEVIEGRVVMGDDKKQVQSELAQMNNTNTGKTKSQAIKDVKQSIDTSTVMAIVKNLVALHRAGVFDDQASVDSIVAKLESKKLIQTSRLLPFRFYSAWKEVIKLSGRGARQVADALVGALDLSIDNLQTIEGYNAIIIDRSGSMQKTLSSMSDVRADEVAAILGAICFKKGVGDIYLFSTTAKRLTEVSSKSTVMDITNKILSTNLGGSTYLGEALKLINNSGVKYDNAILLSDGDCYMGKDCASIYVGRNPSNSFQLQNNQWDETVSTMIKNKVIKKFYLDNLLGNDFAIINTDDFRKNLITGFSERIVDVINIYSAMGRDASDIRKVIDQMVLTLHK